MNTPDKRVEMEKEVKEIGEYLGCNSNELWSEISKLLTQHHQDMLSEVVEKLEGMKKRELRSPRSFGDNESTVDVSSGYNQALTEAQTIINNLTRE